MKSARQFLIAAAVMALALVIFFMATRDLSGTMQKETRKALENALDRDVALCYAVEGRYPPSIDYLKEHYGLVYDDKQFAVFYNGFSSTIKPDITVVSLTEEEAN